MVDFRVECGDAVEKVRSMTEKADLILFSPPYENCRAYGGLPARVGQAWVDWMVEVFRACQGNCTGLVAAVVEGKTKDYKYSATPLLLAADLHRAGFNLRKPPIYQRDGIAGSGGPDWLKQKYEFIICTTPPGKLAWSDNTACGHPPKFPPGGRMSHQSKDGRVNKPRPQLEAGGVRRERTYNPPALANPGNIITVPDEEEFWSPVIDCGSGGGGHLGHPLAHDNEAPFPLRLAEFFVKSFCPPGGLVVDPFCGSGSAGHAAILNGRRFAGFDVRESQVELSRRRLADVAEKMEVAS